MTSALVIYDEEFAMKQFIRMMKERATKRFYEELLGTINWKREYLGEFFEPSFVRTLKTPILRFPSVSIE